MKWIINNFKHKHMLIKNNFPEGITKEVILINPQNISVGKNTYMNSGQLRAGTKAKVKIGCNCAIGYNVNIKAKTHDPRQPTGANAKTIEKDITIGNNVWIGDNTYIKEGVSIGNHTIIGANSMVTKSFGSHLVVAGNPAKIIRSRDQNKDNKSDVLLLYPPSKILDYQCSIPCLAAYLIEKNFTVDILDAPALGYNINDIILYVHKHPTKVIGVSIPFTPLANTGLKTIKALKKSFPENAIVCGGVHPTLVPGEFIDHVDMVCIGDGELTLEEFLNKYLKDKDFHNIKGIAFKKNGKLIINKPRERIDLDTLPFPYWEGVEINNYRLFLSNKEKAMPVILSRGCPFSCNFCSNWILSGKQVKQRTIENVIKEIKLYKEKYSINAFVFRDETFTLNHKRVTSFCNALIKENLAIHWWVQTRANLLDIDMLLKMKQAGCVGVSIGVESGDEVILKKIKKGVTLNEIKYAVRTIKKAGLLSCADFMIGHPWDTPETILKTIQFADELDVDFLGYALTTPYPKTELRETAERYGQITTFDWGDYVTDNVTYIPPGLKNYNLNKIRNIALINFHSQTFRRMYNKWKYCIGFKNKLYDTFIIVKEFFPSYLRIMITNEKYPKFKEENI